MSCMSFTLFFILHECATVTLPLQLHGSLDNSVVAATFQLASMYKPQEQHNSQVSS